MKSSLPKLPLLLSFSPLLFTLLLLLVHPSSSLARKHPSPPQPFSYHNGPLLTGNVNLAIMWYGKFTDKQKNNTLNFIESLNNERNVTLEPSVAQWWHKVESYQLVAKKDLIMKTDSAPAIQVEVVKQVEDVECSLGNKLSSSNYKQLSKKVAAGSPPNTVAVIFSSKNVQAEDVCSGPCYVHGVDEDKQLYMVVGHPAVGCPIERCTSPFLTAEETSLARLLLRPPHNDVDGDAMILHFAASLAATVTNPYSNGFFGGPAGSLTQTGPAAARPGEAATACFGVFGSGSFPGYSGRIRIDPVSTGEFNAHGINKDKFLLPAIWDPEESTCWTTV